MSSKRKRSQIYYAVFNGKEGDQIYESWNDASTKGIHGSKGCKHRKFASKTEAEHFITCKGVFQQTKDHDDGETIIAYSDGTCETPGGVGGYGLWFGDNHKLNQFERFESTNSQVGELSGAVRCIEVFNEQYPLDHPTVLRLDSNYVVQAVNDWIPRIWEPGQWKEKPEKNKQLMMKLWALYKLRTNCRVEKVKGHCNVYGNEQSHKIADMVYIVKESGLYFVADLPK